ncbi:MAG: hypothetical protein EOO07_27970 [Chitinophagaceae bacterium]|nr:MAG: hypothetical protein EOO07_27970 [Chitinophagaceae bacterium]
MRFIFVILLVVFAFADVKGQSPVNEKSTETQKGKSDSGYVNRGKIAGAIAAKRSLILPGLGQVYNYGLIVDDIETGRLKTKGFGKKLAIIGKIGGIYVAGTMLTLSYIENNKNYHLFLKELQYRQANNGQPDPNGSLAGYKDTQSLYTGKAIYKNNREVVLIFLGLTYGVNVIDAYVTARLNYLNIERTLGFKIRPSVMNSNTMYGYNSFTPALTLTLKL